MRKLDDKQNKQYDVMQNINESLVKELFETGKEYTIQEVADITQLTETAASEAIVKLAVRGEIKKIEQRQLHMKIEKYVLNRDYAHKLIIRIRPLVIQYYVYDAANSLVFQKEKPSIESELVDTIVQLVRDISQVYHLQIVVIGSAFMLKNGESISFGNSRDFQEINIKRIIKSKTNIPVIVEKEINAALIGACDLDELKFLDDEYTACLNISPTRIQCAFMYRNILIRGNEGLAGELGLFDFNDDYTLEKILQGDFVKATKEEFIARIVNIIATAFDPKRLIIYKSKVIPELTDKIVREYINLPYRAKIETTFSHEYDRNCEIGLLKLAKQELASMV